MMEKSELFNKLVPSSTRTIKNLNNDTKHNVTSCSYDTQGHAQTYVERYCEIGKQNNR